MAAIRPIEILLVDDHEGDNHLTLKAFRDTKLGSHSTVLRDGEEALACLRRTGVYTRASRPTFILLDLNIPQRDGRKLLRDVKSDQMLKAIPIIVLIGTSGLTDITRSDDIRTNCYIQKPTGSDEFSELVRKLASLRFGVVQLSAAPKGSTT
jgi:two-component system, chemotaxis family, response regulator Rcp1